jgi:hypothetical protein
LLQMCQLLLLLRKQLFCGCWSTWTAGRRNLSHGLVGLARSSWQLVGLAVVWWRGQEAAEEAEEEVAERLSSSPPPQLYRPCPSYVMKNKRKSAG